MQQQASKQSSDEKEIGDVCMLQQFEIALRMTTGGPLPNIGEHPYFLGL
jgi:hypothetical protein